MHKKETDKYIFPDPNSLLGIYRIENIVKSIVYTHDIICKKEFTFVKKAKYETN